MTETSRTRARERELFEYFFPNHNEVWTAENDELLQLRIMGVESGRVCWEDAFRGFGRTERAVLLRAFRLGLLDGFTCN